MKTHYLPTTKCANSMAAINIYLSVIHTPHTKRCTYCRPQWTYGFKGWRRKLVSMIWRPHIIGHDYGPVHGYTDVICDKAEKVMTAILDEKERLNGQR